MDPVKRGGRETSNSEMSNEKLMFAEEEGRKVESGGTGLIGKNLTLETREEESS